MKTIFKSFFSMPAHVLFFLGIPIFYFLFILFYDPFGMQDFLAVGKDRFSLNMILTTLILFGVLVLSRLLLYFLRNVISMNWPLYVLWSIGEVVFTGMMFSILLGLGWKGEMTYFYVMTRCILYLGAIVIFPYLIISLAIQVWDLSRRTMEPVVDEKTLIRFQDDQKRVRIILSSEVILYIEAEENYVHIVYMDGDKVKDYILRSSMRALEAQLDRRGLVRCHRSYFINPVHVQLVKKDTGGFALARLDREGVKNVPVSKRYYDTLSALL